MTGLELCRAYFEMYGKPMLENEFSEVKDRIAVGLVGHGSECFGFDDDLSRDHDFEPGFSLWLTDEDEKAFGFRLFRAYRKLPKSFMGVALQKNSIFGSQTRGVHTISEFYRYYTGCSGAPQSLEAWCKIPSFYLAEATNGEVFHDPLGMFSKIRKELTEGIPPNAMKKRLASSLFLMAQSGQYNVKRCLMHGEYAAATLALHRFAEETVQVIFYLNNRYAPYYKWTFRALKELPKLQTEGRILEDILTRGMNDETPHRIEQIAKGVIDELILQSFCEYRGDYLETYAVMIHDSISDLTLRSMPMIL